MQVFAETTHSKLSSTALPGVAGSTGMQAAPAAAPAVATGDKTAAQQQLASAKEVLARLQQKWGAEIFNRYLTRPDIQAYYKQLG